MCGIHEHYWIVTSESSHPQKPYPDQPCQCGKVLWGDYELIKLHTELAALRADLAAANEDAARLAEISAHSRVSEYAGGGFRIWLEDVYALRDALAAHEKRLKTYPEEK
jgi:hypothetical protein